MARKSTIAGLPDAVRKQLDRLLLDPRVTVEGATQYVNEWLAENTTGDDTTPEKVSKSAIGRYKQSFEEMTRDMVETDRLAAIMLKELNITNQSNVAQATAETLRVMLMHFIPLLRNHMQAGDLSIKEMKDITGMLKDLSAGHERLENSASINEKRRREIEREAAQQAKEAAASTAEQTAKEHGLDDKFAKFLRERVLQGGV